MGRKTQTQAVLEWLQQGRSITSMEAFAELGATRLSAIVFNLRKNGYDIEADTVCAKNRYGQTVCFARYRLKDSPEPYEENVL